MNRRDFLCALGLGASVCALSPLLDLAPIEAAPSAALLNASEFSIYFLHASGLYVNSPATSAYFLNITVNLDGTLRKSA